MKWSRVTSRSRVIALAILAVAAPALAVGVFFLQYRPDQRTDDAVRQAAAEAAEDGAVAVLSYSPDTLPRDIANAIMADAAQQRQVKTTAQVAEAAVSDVHPDSAVVLVFVNKVTSSKQQPNPTMTPATVRVTLTKVNRSWLISEFDPL